jgi:hypothetical protein
MLPTLVSPVFVSLGAIAVDVADHRQVGSSHLSVSSQRYGVSFL